MPSVFVPQDIGDHESAEVLMSSANAMAEYADSQEEWLVVTEG